MMHVIIDHRPLSKYPFHKSLNTKKMSFPRKYISQFKRTEEEKNKQTKNKQTQNSSSSDALKM